MNVDLASGHDDMKHGYEFVCGGCGHKTLVKMVPGAAVTLNCRECGTVIYSNGGPRVFAGNHEIPGCTSFTAEIADIDGGNSRTISSGNGRRKDKPPAVTKPPADENVSISDDENDRARRMLDWLS